MEKHYYLHNGTVKVSDSKMPENKNWNAYSLWLSSLQPCDIDESELEKIKNKVYTFDNCKADNPIEITDIVEEKDGKIFFKQPTEKQAESDAVECNDNNIDTFINKYINDLPKNWRSDLDMYLAMKNAMIQALSYPNVYKIFKNR